jgi:hypothetical protein
MEYPVQGGWFASSARIFPILPALPTLYLLMIMACTVHNSNLSRRFRVSGSFSIASPLFELHVALICLGLAWSCVVNINSLKTTMRASIISAALGVLHLCAWSAKADTLQFLYPTGGDWTYTYYYGNVIEVQYETNFTSPLLYTFCRDASGNILRKFAYVDELL